VKDIKESAAPVVGLIVTDTIGGRMASPGIRFWEFSRVLSEAFSVRLIMPPWVPTDEEATFEGAPAPVRVCSSEEDLKHELEACDIVVTQGVTLYFHPFLRHIDKPLVLDIYVPMLLEDLERAQEIDLASRLNSSENIMEADRVNVRHGDFFLCASERQRDYSLGLLAALGRVNPYTFSQDPSLRQLIDVVPFGISEAPPKHTKNVLKGVMPGIGHDDPLILWNGGIWKWFDTQTVVRALLTVLEKKPNTRLVFMGKTAPPRIGTGKPELDDLMALSQSLGLLDKHIFFQGWVPYEERQNYLLEADVAISLHMDHVETRFAFRTRLLDCLWTALPLVSTEGDIMAETLAQHGLARLVAPGDVEGVAEALLAWLETPNLRETCRVRAAELQPAFRWRSAARPLVDFCHRADFAADKAYQAERGQTGVDAQERSLVAKVWRALRVGGPASLARQTSEYIQWRLRQRR
jgi:glycosyltransferase involved in cell wall biosynthesis